MSADYKTRSGASLASSRATMARIAETLGCSVADLTGPERDPLATKGLSELITIWTELNNDEERSRLLAFAREVAKS